MLLDSKTDSKPKATTIWFREAGKRIVDNIKLFPNQWKEKKSNPLFFL